MKAGIVIDKWKLPIFSKHLVADGFKYEERGQLVEGTIALIVETTSPEALKPTVVKAQVECARTKRDAQQG